MSATFPPRQALVFAALAMLAPALGACSAARTETTGSVYPSDFRDRHPIVLGHAPRILDIFVEGPRGIDARENRDLRAFVDEYRRFGNGPISVQVPSSVPYGGATGAALAHVRAAVGGRVAVSSYVPADPKLASPIRLSFQRLQAKVGTQCGLWPQDLGVADYEYNESNQPYWNLGCATQSNIAAQIADPVDLVRGRQMTAPDTGRRMYNIEQLRKGADPSTTYKTESTSVKAGVSQ